MTCAALLRFTNSLTAFPIAIDTIIDWIKHHTAQDEIDLITVPIDRLKVSGVFRQFTYQTVPYAEAKFVTQVIYPNGLTPEMERLVVCKELLHIFDKPSERVSTSEDVDALINGIILQILGSRGQSAILNDMLGPFLAVAVLIPPSARKKLKAAREAGTHSADEIAEFVGLPIQYVDAWTSPTCDDLERTLLELHECLDLIED
jgi:hypothetical protein